jgi:hypothetical protein
MDLCLALGRTVGELEREMTEVEFGLWQKYAQRRTLPWRRMEMYLARLTQTVEASGMAGGSGAPLRDFLFLDPPDDSAEDGDARDAAEFFAFSPRAQVKE